MTESKTNFKHSIRVDDLLFHTHMRHPFSTVYLVALVGAATQSHVFVII